jgi:hypothetical protein
LEGSHIRYAEAELERLFKPSLMEWRLQEEKDCVNGDEIWVIFTFARLCLLRDTGLTSRIISILDVISPGWEQRSWIDPNRTPQRLTIDQSGRLSRLHVRVVLKVK